jgi:tetratricopeptide (TPR) repeat protein
MRGPCDERRRVNRRRPSGPSRLAAAVAATAAVTLGACGAKATPPPSIATLLGAGSTAFKQGDYSAATQLFQQAIVRDSGNATAHYDLGTAYQAENRSSDALAQYAKAVTYDPTLVSAIFNQATIYSAHNRPLAIYLYQRVISLQPNAATAYLNLGLLEDEQGDKARAGVDLRTAVAQNPRLRSQIPTAVAPDLKLPAPPRRPGRTVPTTAPPP